MTATVGVLRPGSTFEGMIERHGDYDVWFARGLAPTGARIAVHDVVRHAPPDPEDADGWLITGSRSSVTIPEPWAKRLMAWVREAVERDAAILGVCYGHQAMCAALGGRVVQHAEGWEIGTVEVALTEAGRKDPLFAGFPDRFHAHTTHEDHVVDLPPDAVLLAGNDHSPVQSAALGARARTVQFHPEVTEPIARDFVAARRHLLPEEPRVQDARVAPRVLVNWYSGFVALDSARNGGS